jgi:hypothetical protein
MSSPISGFHNVWNFSRMLAGVGAQKPATPPAKPAGEQAPTGQKAPNAPPKPAGDAYHSSQAERVNQLRTSLASNPSAQAALQHLDTGGRLNRKGVMNQLERLQGNPELLGQAVKDLAHPGQMRQGADNKFCAQTDALSHMARQDPAAYAKMIADLSAKGSAQVKNGVTLKAQTGLDQSQMQSMSATQKLAAPALAEYANGAGMKVDARGVSHATDGRKTDRTVQGTYSTGMEKMQQALIGHNWDSQYIADGKKNHASSVNDAVRTIHDNLKAGEDPSISRNGHWFNVTGFRATPDGGRMTVTDPLTGASKTVNAKHFLDKAEAVTFDKTDLGKVSGGGAAPTKAELARPKDEDPGGGGKAGAGSNPVDS